jgi:predicted ATPase
MLTLTGPPGVGKSRLAAEVAPHLAREMGGAAAAVALGDLAPSPGLEAAFAAAVGAPSTGARSADALAARLVGRRLLLVLDDVDRHIDALAALIGDLLASCADLSVLATGREPLRVAGEVVYAVAPLDGAAADRLFEATAGRAAPEVVRSLDGLPLFIELAAAGRSPSQEAGGARPARHRSVEAALDWSVERLSPGERGVFMQICAFDEPFTLDEAEKACAGAGVEAADVLELLLALVDKSLVVADERDGDLTYRLLGLVRDHGRALVGAAVGVAEGQGPPSPPVTPALPSS